MIDLNDIFISSENVVAREIEGEIIIVPLVSGIGDEEDDLFTLNDTGKAIWKLLDGNTNVSELINHLSSAYDASIDELQKDVIGLLDELLKRRIISIANNDD